MIVEQSKMLTEIIEEAERIRREKGYVSLSKNLFIAAVVQLRYDYHCDISRYDGCSEREKLTIEIMLESHTNANNYEGVIEEFSSYPVLPTDGNDFVDALNEASQYAEKYEDNVVYADDFLLTVLKTPSKEIYNFFTRDYPESQKKSWYDRLLKEKKTSIESVKEFYGSYQKPEIPIPKSIFEEPTSKESIEGIIKKTKKLQKKLSKVVFGQDNAIDIFTAGYFHAEIRKFTEKNAKKPKATFLFAGPPGVGKTFFAEKIAESLNLPYRRFDMSQYTDSIASSELCGVSDSFHGATEGSLTGFVNSNPKCVILLDEIEKCSMNVIYLFLQVLDAGRLRDVKLRKDISFKDVILIFTTNAGRKIYEDSQTMNLAHISRKTILKALENDYDPKTGRGSFPAALCSRFATGNVVMFNHMEAHTLRSIVENEITKYVSDFSEKTKIKCEVSNEIPSCVMFAEGGYADARTVTSKAKTFISDEIYELLRLISQNDNNFKIKDLEKIEVSVSLNNCEDEIKRLFVNDIKPSALIVASARISLAIQSALHGVKIDVANSYDEAVKLLHKNSHNIILCDIYAGMKENSNSLNAEDIRSMGRAFCEYACEHSDTPVYIVHDSCNIYTDEEEFSFVKRGVRQIVDVSECEVFYEKINRILEQLQQQSSMMELARANKALTYNTVQTISADGKTATIQLYNMKLKTMVDAEDRDNVLSGMSKPAVRFDDVIGADEAKTELQFFVDYLKNPKEFAEKGLGVPKGVLFYGPPGTGKTMLAKALAGETNLTFISTEGNRFFDKFVGVGEARVHQLFSTARKYAPSIIFIDEVDAIAKERTGSENHPSRETILTALLAEMDGFKVNVKKPVFVLAATNYDIAGDSERKLDGAFVRRFDRQIYIGLPDKASRIKYMNTRIAKNSVFRLSDSMVENIAVRSTGMSLSNLDSVFNFSLRIAMRTRAEFVDDTIFEEAFETYNFGEEKKWDSDELIKTAYHEAGHAFVCWKNGEKPSYLTIVARANHAGYMLHGDENIGAYTKEKLLGRIRTALAGRASEMVFFGETAGLTTGASSDLSKATAIANNMICKYGMDDSIGLAVVSDGDVRDGVLAMKIREAINKILVDELEKAKEILKDNKKSVDALVDALMEKNYLTADEIEKIISANI